MTPPEKLTSLTGLRLAAGLTARLDAICALRGERRPQFIRRALVEALAREEAAAVAITPAQLHLLAVCARAAERGVDVPAILTAALESQLAGDVAQTAPAPVASAA